MITNTELLTIPEVAAALRISERTVKRMLAAGTLPRVRIGRAVRIRRTDVQKLTEPAN